MLCIWESMYCVQTRNHDLSIDRSSCDSGFNTIQVAILVLKYLGVICNEYKSKVVSFPRGCCG